MRDPDAPDTSKGSPVFRAWARRTKLRNKRLALAPARKSYAGLRPEWEIRVLIGSGVCHDRGQALWLMFLSGDLYSFSSRGRLHRISRGGKALWLQQNHTFGYQMMWRWLADVKAGRTPFVRSIAEVEMRARTYCWTLPAVPPHVEVDWGNYRRLYVVSPIAPVAYEPQHRGQLPTGEVVRAIVEALTWLDSQDKTKHPWLESFCRRELGRWRNALYERQYACNKLHKMGSNLLKHMWISLRSVYNDLRHKEPLTPDPCLWGELPDFPIFGWMGLSDKIGATTDGEESQEDSSSQPS